MRPAATALVTLAMALGAVALAFGAPGRDAAGARLTAATGAVRISNSKEGQAVFGADALRPGASTAGDVRIGNDGNVRAIVTLTGTRVAEAGAVSLANTLQLNVFDVTRGNILYSGPAASFATVTVGALAVGESRVVRFTATLPRTADNSLQGASTTLGLRWSAVAAALPTPTPTPTKPRTPTAPTTPNSVSLADAIGMPRAGTRVRKGQMRLRVHALDGAKVLAAKVAVNGKVKKRVKGSRAIVKVNLRKLRGRKVKIAVTIRASDGRKYTAKRSYRVAAKRR